jgi:hypothetical protein
MRGLSPYWAALVDRWSEIEASHLAEVGLRWTKARSAPKTFKLMCEILDPIRSPNVLKVGRHMSITFPPSGGGSQA